MPLALPFVSGAHLSIDVPWPVVLLRGASSDISHVLSGEVVLMLNRPTSATHVAIKLVGKSSTVWPEGIGARGTKLYHEKVIHEQNIILSTEAVQLQSGMHKWPFEFLMSNHLVETIEDEFAKISYHLTATIERSGFGATKMKTRKDILLLRTEWNDHALTDNAQRDTSVNIERRLKSCEASICLEKTTASSGTDVAVDLMLSPLLKNVHLESISAVLTERRIYRLPEYQACRREFTDQDIMLKRTIDISEFATADDGRKVSESDLRKALTSYYAQIPLSGSPFQQRLIFTLPNCLRTNHSTTFPEINFRHWLKLDIVLSRPVIPEDGLNMEEKQITFDRIRLDIPMTILDCRLKEDFGALPTYHAAVMDYKLEDEAEIQGFQCPCFVAFRKTQKKCAKPHHIPGSHHTLPDLDTYPAHSPPHYDRLEGLRRFESLHSSLAQTHTAVN
ncbi:hypothetical protein VKS41_009314 [Umbelopsis sp. WA50703]